MTITYHDGFAFKPKRCDYCGRLFWLEYYDTPNDTSNGVGIWKYKCKCKKCLKGEKLTADIRGVKE